MSIDTDLRTTIPDDLEALDHEDLQRRGRHRRIGTRSPAGSAHSRSPLARSASSPR